MKNNVQNEQEFICEICIRNEVMWFNIEMRIKLIFSVCYTNHYIMIVTTALEQGKG